MRIKRDEFGFPEPEYLPATDDEELPVPGTKKFERLNWPDDVPVLVESDLLIGKSARGSDKDKTGKRTLYLWALETFPSGLCYQIVRRELDRQIKEKIKYARYQHTHWNVKDRKTFVDIWNSVMGWLGYEIEKPKKKKLDLPSAFQLE